MEENTQNVKVAYIKALPSLNLNATFNTIIDTNVKIKNVLDINIFVFDIKTECGNGKAVVNGKIGMKVLYIDTDNITNTLTDSVPFSESYVNPSITNDCVMIFSVEHISYNILSIEGNLKVNCESLLKPLAYMNLPLGNTNNYNNMIVKKSQMETSTINQYINTNFEYTTTFETKDSISKVLYHNAHFANTKTTCFDGYVVVEGKLYSTLVYETQVDDQYVIKELTDCFNLKTDVELSNVTNENILDAALVVDKFKETISTEVDDANNVITVVNNLKLEGVCLKNISIDIVDDLYSTENELELNYNKRDFVKSSICDVVETSVSGEIMLSNQETAIDAVISNLTICPEITNSYLKDGFIFVEGLISSNLTYIDENKEYKQKPCEIPFIVNTNIAGENVLGSNSTVNVIDCKVKIKRGTIIELDYKLCVKTCNHELANKDMVDSVKIGKQLDFSNYDYQIYLAKPNETIWELCKRIKTTPENLRSYNKNLPLELTGNEKIIVKR